MNSQLNCFHSVHCNCSAVQSMSEHVHQQLCYTGCTAARRLFPASWIWYSSEYGMTPEQKKSQHVVSVFGSDKSISIKLLQITKITEVYVLSSQCFTDSVSLNCFATFTQKHLFPFLWSLLVCMAFFFLFFLQGCVLQCLSDAKASFPLTAVHTHLCCGFTSRLRL